MKSSFLMKPSKKIWLFGALIAFLMSCTAEREQKEIDYRALREAQLLMDVSAGKQNKIKKIDIIGDSIAIHKLSRYMSNFMGRIVQQAMYTDTANISVDYPFDDCSGLMWYSRDTIRHTFTISNHFVVWYEMGVYDEDGNWKPDEVDPRSYRLGSLVCMEDLVFCAMVDTVTGIFIDRMNDWDRVLPPFALEYNQYRYDTLGYIPNSQMRANRAHLQMLLDNNQYQEMLDYFKTAYHIYTCTGEEYRELVRLGLN